MLARIGICTPPPLSSQQHNGKKQVSLTRCHANAQAAATPHPRTIVRVSYGMHGIYRPSPGDACTSHYDFRSSDSRRPSLEHRPAVPCSSSALQRGPRQPRPSCTCTTTKEQIWRQQPSSKTSMHRPIRPIKACDPQPPLAWPPSPAAPGGKRRHHSTQPPLRSARLLAAAFSCAQAPPRGHAHGQALPL